MSKEKLNIVDEAGNILGEETRENIHKNGLLHREIHVWFFTPNKELIFQHRAKDKDTFPDLLDATVGGHVEIGDDYEKTALKEIEEETGVRPGKEDLKFLKMIRFTALDSVSGMQNNAIQAVYAFRYGGEIDGLRVEEGKSEGFEEWSFENILQATEEDKKLFVPGIFTEEILQIIKEVQKLAS